MNPAITAALIAAQQSEAADPVARLTKAGALDSSTGDRDRKSAPPPKRN